jgi:phosphatidylglycerophosphate synthase
MSAVRYFRWLPNALTLSRGVLGVVAFVATTNDNWAFAFWVLWLAFTTDFLDGLAAKKLHAQTNLGKQLDRFTDGTLSGLGALGLAAAGVLPWWAFVVSGLMAGFLAFDRFFIPKTGALHRLRPVLSVGYMLLYWVVLAWAYLTLAYGWSWGYPLITFGVLMIAGLLKRHRLRDWAGAPPKRRARPAK